MTRLGPGARALAASLVGVLIVVGGLVPNAQAQTPDRSDVVLVLDFSASILEDAANRNRFGAALERIADRVDATSADLIAGDVTVTIVQFATRAGDFPGCANLRLLNSAETVGHFADCLRAVAGAYRRGMRPSLTKAIGIDTNYVAAMEVANSHLPQDAVRPALILFTDGKHDVKGVPVSEVQAARDRLFGARSPFALLPVGMGLDPAERGALAQGLETLRVTRDMPACVSGATFLWPTVVFESAEEAGTAVAVALEDATCTFTAAPSPTPTPTPTPAPTPGLVQGIRLTAHDGAVDVAWTPAATKTAPIIDYKVRCHAGEEDWIESKEGISLAPGASVDGLVNGMEYRCEVAAVGPESPGAWTAASSTITPMGRPVAPGKPSVEALDGAVGVKVPPDAGALTKYRFECSGDNGATWPRTIDVQPGSATAALDGLRNGVDYRCRAFAVNAIGASDTSPLSDTVRPCGSVLDCNPVLLPVLGILVFLLVGGLLTAFVALYRARPHGHVVAVVDTVHTANIGHGSTLGIAFVQAADTRRLTGILADRGPDADVFIRRLRGGRFSIKDRTGRRIAADGEAVVVADSVGARHSLVLQAFATSAASQVPTRR